MKLKIKTAVKKGEPLYKKKSKELNKPHKKLSRKLLKS
jgi:hypothetical protein